MLPSPLAEIKDRESLLKTTPLTSPEEPASARTSNPVWASQSLTVWSIPPEASQLPSGLKARLKTSPALAVIVRTAPEATVNNATLLSAVPAASMVPSGLTATAFTCPLNSKVLTTVPVARFDNLTVLSVLPEAIRDELGTNARLVTSPVCPVRFRVRFVATSSR